MGSHIERGGGKYKSEQRTLLSKKKKITSANKEGQEKATGDTIATSETLAGDGGM